MKHEYYFRLIHLNLEPKEHNILYVDQYIKPNVEFSRTSEQIANFWTRHTLRRIVKQIGAYIAASPIP